MIKVNAITCPKCGDTIYSRARHDYRECSCGGCFIDGGFDYVRTGGKRVLTFELEIKATRQQLYDDWNYFATKYGLIKGEGKMNKTEKSIKKGLKEAKEKKVTKANDIDRLFKEIETKRKAHPIYYFFSGIFWGVYRYINSIPLNVRTFIQRGKRGWANSDTWGFDYYLTKVISEGVHNLKENIHGMPSNLTEGQWIDILNKITYTFELAHRMTKDELYLIKDKKVREKWQKFLGEHNKKYKCHDRCMTNKEIREYNEGWKLFREYFFDLWD